MVRREDSGKTQTNLLGSKFNSGLFFSLFEHNPRSGFFCGFLKGPAVALTREVCVAALCARSLIDRAALVFWEALMYKIEMAKRINLNMGFSGQFFGKSNMAF